jgi:uncharacterized OB-fold protein
VAPTAQPAIEGWFSTGAAPALLGTRCDDCGTYAFPKAATFCANPACTSTSFTEVALSTTGTVWSYTMNHYQPPEPYVSPQPFEPYGVVAAELEAERLVILGQLAAGFTADDLAVGATVELVIETLYTDDEGDHLVWRWKPTAANREA